MLKDVWALATPLAFAAIQTRFARMGRMALQRFSSACGMPQRGGRFQPRRSALLTPI
jgi:hypothetical protein